MPTARVRISINVDGVPVPGFPVARRIESPTEALLVDGVVPPASSLGSVFGGTNLQKVVALQTDRRITMRLFGQSTAPSALNPGGLLVILNATLSGNTFVDNPGTVQAHVTGVVLG